MPFAQRVVLRGGKTLRGRYSFVLDMVNKFTAVIGIYLILIRRAAYRRKCTSEL
jgi:hypothetical protein